MGQRSMSWKVISTAVLFCVSTAGAAPWPPELRECAAQKDPAARLACYDRAAAAAESVTAPPSASQATPAPASVAHAVSVPAAPAPAAQKDPRTDPDYGLEGAALRRRQSERGELPAASSKPQPLIAHVVQVTRIGQAEVTVRLDNGQVWKQTDGAGNLAIAPKDTVTITAGSLGAYFLTCADRRVIHVRRIQ